VTTENEEIEEPREGEEAVAAAPETPVATGGEAPVRTFAPRGDGAPFRRPRRPGGKDRFAPRRKVDQFAVMAFEWWISKISSGLRDTFLTAAK